MTWRIKNCIYIALSFTCTHRYPSVHPNYSKHIRHNITDTGVNCNAFLYKPQSLKNDKLTFLT